MSTWRCCGNAGWIINDSSIDVVFEENTAGDSGGGMNSTGGGDPKLVNVAFTRNTAGNYGGAIHSNSIVTIHGGVFWGNHASNLGGALVFGKAAGQPELLNVTIVGNTGTCGAIYNRDTTTYVFNSIVWNNHPGSHGMCHEEAGSLQVRYSDVTAGYPGERNINADPQFKSATSGDLHLTAGSPAIDAGSDTLSFDVEFDMDWHQRTVLAVDMGADEFWPYPDAVNDIAETLEDTKIVIDGLANDTDPDGNLDPSTLTVSSGLRHGSATADVGTREISYTPNTN